MTEYQLDLFSLVLDKVKKYKGYTIVGILKDADPGANIINFDTKEEFEQNFEGYNRRGFTTWRLSRTSELEFWCDDGPYLVIDGILQR